VSRVGSSFTFAAHRGMISHGAVYWAGAAV
jgi:hypothetical protein